MKIRINILIMWWIATAFLVYNKANAQQLVFNDADCILGADLFTDELEILSASVGFDNVIGVGTTEQDAIDLGLAWNYLVANLTECPVTGGNISEAPLTSGVPPTVRFVYDCNGVPDTLDGFPICFSWPVLPCSIKREHIQYTRSDRQVFNPQCIGPAPNQEFNERHCIVIFDHFINKQLPGEEGRLAMDRIDVVGDILFVGPQGVIKSGKGLSREAPPDETPYITGPSFVGARLSPLDTVGEGNADDFSILDGRFIPNSGVDLFGDNTNNNLYRLRMIYSGGMTPNGLTSTFPTMFEDYFVLQFDNGMEIDSDGQAVAVTSSSTVTVLGIADLGLKQDVGYDICYAEDRDNYFDIILELDGDESVFENIKVLAFSKDKFLYNPGGPGPTPFEDARYTAPSPANQLVTVRVDLENVHQTTFCLKNDDTWSRNVADCQAWRVAGELHEIPVGSVLASQRSCPANLMERVNAEIIGNPPTEPPTEPAQQPSPSLPTSLGGTAATGHFMAAVLMLVVGAMGM